MNFDDPTLLILVGMVLGSLGPIIVIIGNVTQIWKRVSDGTRYEDILETKRKLAAKGSITTEDPAFDTILDLLDPKSTDEDDITKIRIDSSGLSVKAGYVRVFVDPQDFDSSETLCRDYGLMMDIEKELREIKDRGEHLILYLGMVLLVIGFSIQATGVVLDSSLI